MEYAGMVRKQSTIQRGTQGLYQRYAIHYALVLVGKALNMGNASTEDVISALTTRSAHQMPHTRGLSLLDEKLQVKCTLNLEPCQICKAPRVSEDARFCVKCGSPLTEKSVYMELLSNSIDRLPLTEHKINLLKKENNLKTVKDIILDEGSVIIRGVRGIGPVWAKRIHTAAEEFVNV